MFQFYLTIIYLDLSIFFIIHIFLQMDENHMSIKRHFFFFYQKLVVNQADTNCFIFSKWNLSLFVGNTYTKILLIKYNRLCMFTD